MSRGSVRRPRRRAFLAGVGAALAASTIDLPTAHAATGASGISWPQGQALPRFAAPKSLDVTDIVPLSGDEKLLLGTLQGLVNRTLPRVYLIGDDAANGEGRLTWLRDLKVPYAMVNDAWSLVAKYRSVIRGSIVFDPAVPDSINVATTLAGLKDGVVASPGLADKLTQEHGVPVIEDLRGRFASRIEAYQWEFEHLWPQTTHRMLIGLPPQKDVSLPPGVPPNYTTLARASTHLHDASNRKVYEFDLKDHLGGEGVWVRFDDAFTNDGWGPAVHEVVVRADGQVLAQFVPGTEAEDPYLFDTGNSQTSLGPPLHRFADGNRYFVYQFNPPAGTRALTLSVEMWNEYVVSVSRTEPRRPGKVGYAYLRDYAVANRAMTFWLDPNVAEERALFERIMSEVQPNTPYLGWFAQDIAGEFGGTELCSRHGVYVLAADWFENMSVHSGAQAPILDGQGAAPRVPLENKIYVTFTMSEGDNLQYNEHRLRILWDNPGRGSVPINWTTSPLLKDAAPNFLSYFQKTATRNDLLIAGPSGAGYIYPNPWPDETFNTFTRSSRKYMDATGMDIVYVLNRIDGRDVDLSESKAKAYVDDVAPRGLFLNWGGTSVTKLLPGGTPLSTIRGVGATDEAQRALADATAGWDGKSPRFVALGILSWSMTPQDLQQLAASLGAEYKVVRGDQYFDLVKRAMR
nr:GxGYxYP domain-containing protein [Actinopolymorpha alba]